MKSATGIRTKRKVTFVGVKQRSAESHWQSEEFLSRTRWEVGNRTFVRQMERGCVACLCCSPSPLTPFSPPLPSPHLSLPLSWFSTSIFRLSFSTYCFETGSTIYSMMVSNSQSSCLNIPGAWIIDQENIYCCIVFSVFDMVALQTQGSVVTVVKF